MWVNVENVSNVENVLLVAVEGSKQTYLRYGHLQTLLEKEEFSGFRRLLEQAL